LKIARFEEIFAWQKAKTLSVDIYEAFKASMDFGFRDQIQRASVSIMNNIAEGFERQTNREFKQYLYIAKGSCAEVRSMLYLAEELKYLEKTIQSKLSQETVEVTKILNGLIKSIRSN
jgi:four helix bundle protein